MPGLRNLHPTLRLRPRGVLGHLACGAVAALDRLGSGLPAAGWLSARSLWREVPLAPAAAPPGPPLLALSFDLDYQQDTDALPRLLEILERTGSRATFFAIGRLVEDDPSSYREALAAGHEIGNHTWSHPDNPVLDPHREFHRLSEDEIDEQIGRAQDAFDRLLGVRPRGFRSPHFKEAHPLLRVLERHPEIDYLSSVLTSQSPASAPYFPAAAAIAGRRSLAFAHRRPDANSRLLMVPMNPCPDHRFTHFCSYHTVRRPADPLRAQGQHAVEELPSLWRRLLERALPHRFASVYFDPMDVVHPEVAGAFERLLRDAAATGWRALPLAAIATLWRSHLAAGGEAPAAETDA